MNLGARINIEETKFDDFNSKFIQVRTIPRNLEVYGIILAYIEFCALYLQIPNKFGVFDNFVKNSLCIDQDQYEYLLWFYRNFFGKEGGMDFIDNAAQTNDFIIFVHKVIEAMTSKGCAIKIVSAYSFLTKNLNFSITTAENGKTLSTLSQEQPLFHINLIYRGDTCNIFYPKIGLENEKIGYEIWVERNKTLLHCGCLVDNRNIRNEQCCQCGTKLYSVEAQILQIEDKVQNHILPKRDRPIIPQQVPNINPQPLQPLQPLQPFQPHSSIPSWIIYLLSILIIPFAFYLIIYFFYLPSFSSIASPLAYNFNKERFYKQRLSTTFDKFAIKEFTILQDHAFSTKDKKYIMKKETDKIPSRKFDLIQDYLFNISTRHYLLEENESKKSKLGCKEFSDLDVKGWQEKYIWDPLKTINNIINKII